MEVHDVTMARAICEKQANLLEYKEFEVQVIDEYDLCCLPGWMVEWDPMRPAPLLFKFPVRLLPSIKLLFWSAGSESHEDCD